MNIGQEDEQYIIEPVEDPFPIEEPARLPDPDREREREPARKTVEVPA